MSLLLLRLLLLDLPLPHSHDALRKVGHLGVVVSAQVTDSDTNACLLERTSRAWDGRQAAQNLHEALLVVGALLNLLLE